MPTRILSVNSTRSTFSVPTQNFTSAIFQLLRYDDLIIIIICDSGTAAVGQFGPLHIFREGEAIEMYARLIEVSLRVCVLFVEISVLECYPHKRLAIDAIVDRCCIYHNRHEQAGLDPVLQPREIGRASRRERGCAYV